MALTPLDKRIFTFQKHVTAAPTPDLHLFLGPAWAIPHHLVIVVKGKWWFTRLSVGHFAFAEHLKRKIQLKVTVKHVFLLGV